MSRQARAALLVTAVILLLGLALAVHTWVARPLSIDWFFARMHWQELRADPERLSPQDGVLSALSGASRKLTDLSPLARAAAHQRALAFRETLAGYDCSGLLGERRQSCEVLAYSLDMRIEQWRWRHYDHPVNPLFGLQSALISHLAAQHEVASRSDAEAYLARLRAVEGKIDGLLLDLGERQAAGVLPPRSMVSAVLDDLRAFVALPMSRHPLRQGLVQQLDRLPDAHMPAQIRADLTRRAEDLIEQSVVPAWRRLIAHYELLQAQALTDEGAWSQPDGEAYYEFMARWHTTTEMTPQEIHALGLAEVARLSADLDSRLSAAGLDEGSVGARLRTLGRREDQRFGRGQAARDAVLLAFRGMIEEAQTASAAAFEVTPATPVTVEAVADARERSAPGGYYSPPSARSSTGTVFVNLRDLDDLPRFTLRSLVHHEAVPGHHWQTAWALERADLPAFRRQMTFSAYAEGWAMYAEMLALELGLLESAEDDIGRLQAEMFRAARLVVDTGLHRERWTVEQAEDYLRENAGLGAEEAGAEVQRYLVYPGQALCFQIGRLRFLQLRALAERELGEAFDLRQFHSVLLDGGRLPLDLLQARVERWITSVRTVAEAT